MAPKQPHAFARRCHALPAAHEAIHSGSCVGFVGLDTSGPQEWVTGETGGYYCRELQVNAKGPIGSGAFQVRTSRAAARPGKASFPYAGAQGSQQLVLVCTSSLLCKRAMPETSDRPLIHASFLRYMYRSLDLQVRANASAKFS